jgi:hypothetical protein
MFLDPQTAISLVEAVTKVLGPLVRLLESLLSRSRGTPKLRVRIREDEPDRSLGNLVFEVENRSEVPTSLEPLIEATFLYPDRLSLRKGKGQFDVRDEDRLLEPYRARSMSATKRELPDSYLFSWFRVYRFRTAHGTVLKHRVRNAFLEPLGPVSFGFELMQLRLLSRLTRNGPRTIEEYRTLKRSQGPH